ncbi:MAG: hypothetical protein RQ745_01000 [Longimicrobiales bacterium]|nr:hypothetical protein [Longimicrobiales bacterium]
MHRLPNPACFLGLAFALLLAPIAASAQIALLPKVGSTGLGGDIAIALTDRVSVRGGIGTIPIEFEGVEIDGLKYDITTPDLFTTVGLDLRVAGPLRLIGGLLFRSGDFEYETFSTGTIEIGNQTFTETGRLFGKWKNNTTSPYVGIGLGSTTGSGLGLFLDAGVAFTGDPEITAEVDGNLANVPGVLAEVERERQNINDDIPGYAEYWPFVQIGFRLGIG